MSAKTSQQAILNALSALRLATAQELFSEIGTRPEGKKIGLTSVYRNLHVLEQQGAIKPVNLLDGVTRYELNKSDRHNHYLVCSDCRRIEVLDECPMEGFLHRVSERFRVQFHNLEIFGRCLACESAPTQRDDCFSTIGA
jgi:Fe2+ or Zn2+ uptake regulation protein